MTGPLICDRAKVADRLSDDPRDLHLADAQTYTDLRLREIVLEAQTQSLALARRQRTYQPVEHRAVFCALIVVVVAAK